ncbi:PfaD family polyunsaturated fatty acid/polyketide biosynthesis protein [Nocardia sp. NBC_01499]|uniref:PfaD family polyunsaturated fatty acid/polyketide biosynthesis protein n=1 Tax=Nocardia sp. NBC_01499 TaxID=2903597 RepID=UPI003867DF23
MLPPLFAEQLGDPTFAATHGVRFPYVAGEMANGIAGTGMVSALARGRMLGFFGAAGLELGEVEVAVAGLVRELAGLGNWGVNLIHNPAEPGSADRLVDLLQRFGVAKVSASAFMELTPAVVRCVVSGLAMAADGGIRRGVHLFAKVSRVEVASKFMQPAPIEMLRLLVGRGQITEAQARMAAGIPLATDVTVEADSGGHTDNRPMTVVLPAVLALRDELTRRYGYRERIRVGAAGGLGDPSGVAAAFACGADYVMTGTVNQRAVEAGLSDAGKELLAEADLADVVMAPAADMFEYGVKVQVLRRGTMFGARAAILYDAYCAHDGLDSIAGSLRTRIERDILRESFDEAWAQARAFWLHRDPEQVTRAETDPKHLMALVFRSYLGRSSRWAITGDPARRADYQIWCGPAIGAFNRWIADSPLAEPGQCTVVQIGRNLLTGAAVVSRAQQLRSFGVPVPRSDVYVPRLLS